MKDHQAIQFQIYLEVLFCYVINILKDIQSGYFKDNDLNTDNLRKYDVPDFYKLYIACVCIHPDYQNTSAFSSYFSL